MDRTQTPDRTRTILDPGTVDLLAMLLADRSPQCLEIPAAVASETTDLLRAAGVHQGEPGELIALLERSVAGGVCSLSVAMCDAAALVLADISATALPEAVRADELAALFKTKSQCAS